MILTPPISSNQPSMMLQTSLLSSPCHKMLKTVWSSSKVALIKLVFDEVQLWVIVETGFHLVMDKHSHQHFFSDVGTKPPFPG